MPNTDLDFIPVATAVIENDRGHVLVAKRPESAHQGGLWEFPGGKRNTQESRYDALCRECHEELGIVIKQARPLIQIKHQYSDRQVLLDVWRVRQYTGDPEGREGQPLCWVDRQRLSELLMPAADRPIIDAIRLPEFYVITPEPPKDNKDNWDPFLRYCENILKRGYLLQLRAKSLTKPRYLSLAGEVLGLAGKHAGQVLLNTELESVMQTDARGIHLSAAYARRLVENNISLPPSLLSGMSCHNTHELKYAEHLGVNFVVLGPVLATKSHPDAHPLGWEQFSAWVVDARFPVYALGGLQMDDLAFAHSVGSQGIAGISCFLED